MSTKKIILSVLALATLAIQPLSAYVISFCVWRLPRPDGTFATVVVIGERHADELGVTDQKYDPVHKPVFMAELERWADAKVFLSLEAAKSNFESREIQYAHLAKTNLPHVGLEHELKRFSHKNNFQFKNMTMNWADLRDDGIAAMVEFIHVIKGGDLQYGQHMYSMYKKRELGTTVIDYNGHDFLKTFKSNIERLQSHKNSSKPGTHEHDVFTNYTDRLENSYKNWQSLLKRNLPSLDAPCIEAVWKDRIAAPEDRALDPEVHFLPIYWDIADAGFIMDIEKNKTEHDKIVCFMGNSHAVEVDLYLEKVGAQCIRKVGSLDKGAFAPVPVDQLRNLMRNAFIQSESCQLCHLATESIKRCGACKVAKYCSADCQKKDWKEHKLGCKK